MPRRIFTTRDLAPLRAITERILEKEPDAALVAAAAGPFKRRIPKPEHEERSELRMPVDIETSTNPQGVPLHEIANELQREVPGVTGISVTPGGISLKFEREPTVAQRRKINALLSDRTRLEELKPGIRGGGGAAGGVGGVVAGAGVRRAPVGDEADAEADATRVLLDPETSDVAWLRAFRSYATRHLFTPPQEPPEPGGSGEEEPAGPRTPKRSPRTRK